jgi:Rrf2 family protein
MKFTALEEYGLRCILRLAQREVQERERTPCGADRDSGESSGEAGAFITLGDLAAEEGLTPEYAGKIFRVLQKSKLVESVRGRKGGYRLARPPEKITVGETLDALGGRLFDGDVCGRYTGDRHECVHSTDCAIRSLWRELQAMMDRVLVRTSLKDLVTSEHVMSRRVQEYAGDAQSQPPPPLSRGLVTVGPVSQDMRNESQPTGQGKENSGRHR